MHQDCLSPHQLPLARELVARLGADKFRYVYRDKAQADRVKLGWKMSGEEPWFVHVGSQPELAQDLVENAECLLTMFRDTDLIARRSAKGLKTFYDSERWFKPLLINLTIPLSTYFLDLLSLPRILHLSLPGWVKLFCPSYFKMAMRMAALLFKYSNFRYLPIGPHAARDMRLICRIYKLFTFHFSLFTPSFLPWGYFVEEGKSNEEDGNNVDDPVVKVLYVGRLLDLKHVDTIIRAVALANKGINSSTVDLDLLSRPRYTLTIVGDGPEKTRLEKLASDVDLLSRPTFSFQSSIPISEVRSLMRQHDVLVFASDASDGWGAVVSEALSEGTPVIGTYETGASAALLPGSQLFHCGDHKELARKLSAVRLQSSQSSLLPPDYTPSGAAQRLIQEMKNDV